MNKMGHPENGRDMAIKKETDMQVTAQLYEERTAKLKRLQSLTRLSAEEILTQGIDLVEQQQTELCRESSDAILNGNFVGCLKDVPEDLATNYEAYLMDALRRCIVLADSGYWKALASPRDEWHDAAVAATHQAVREPSAIFPRGR